MSLHRNTRDLPSIIPFHLKSRSRHTIMAVIIHIAGDPPQGSMHLASLRERHGCLTLRLAVLYIRSGSAVFLTDSRQTVPCIVLKFHHRISRNRTRGAPAFFNVTIVPEWDIPLKAPF